MQKGRKQDGKWAVSAPKWDRSRSTIGLPLLFGRSRVRGGPRHMEFFPKRSLTAQFSLIWSGVLAAVVKTKLGQLPPSLVVLDDESGPH